jgi:hypothetical protein
VSPALLHDVIEICRAVQGLLQTQAVGLVDGFEDLLTCGQSFKISFFASYPSQNNTESS